MSKIFVAVVVSLLLLGTALATDIAKQQTPDSQTQNESAELIGKSIATVQVIPLVLVVVGALAAAGTLGRLV